MALGFTETGGGNGAIMPIIKYDTRAGEFLRVDRTQGADGVWVKSESELPFPLKFVADFENIKVGWLGFVGGAPDFHLVPLNEAMPARPSNDHNQGFQLMIANKELGLREFSSGAKTVTTQMNALHDMYESGKGANPGKVPVVEVSGAERFTVTTPNGDLTFKKPIWSITEWIDRPAMLDGASSAPAETAPAPVVSAPAASPAAPSAALDW